MRNGVGLLLEGTRLGAEVRKGGRAKKVTAFEDQYAVAQDPGFQTKIEVAILKVASLIQGEGIGGLTGKQWDKRAALARDVILGGGPHVAADGTVVVSWVEQFAIVVPSTNASITLLSPDNDIEFQVTAVWDDMAGVTGRDLG